jgi:hypothetical protein
MRRLKRLETRGTELSDGLLCAAGAVPLEYMFVHMGHFGYMPGVTAVGAAAAEGIGTIELQVHKKFVSCCQKFTQLPCVKRFLSECLILTASMVAAPCAGLTRLHAHVNLVGRHSLIARGATWPRLAVVTARARSAVVMMM